MNKKCNTSLIPTKKLADLTENTSYKISSLKEVNTQFGSKIVAVLDDEFNVFLPDRCKIHEEKETLKVLQKWTEEGKLFLLYLGSKAKDFEIKYICNN